MDARARSQRTKPNGESHAAGSSRLGWMCVAKRNQLRIGMQQGVTVREAPGRWVQQLVLSAKNWKESRMSQAILARSGLPVATHSRVGQQSTTSCAAGGA